MKRLITIFVVFSCLSNTYGQETTSSPELLNYAKKLSQRNQVRKAETIQVADSLGMPMKVIQGNTIIELSHFVNGFPRFLSTDNINAAATTAASAIWPGGSAGLNLSGSGIVLGVWDGGAVLTTHQEFGGRVSVTDGTVALSSHATHVAGTMIAAGIDPLAKGMSFEAGLLSYDWTDDNGEMAAAAASGLQVSNHSYGYLTGWSNNYRGDGKWVWFGDTTLSRTSDYGFGAYEQTSHDWDTLAFMAPEYLIVKSSGNDRFEGPATQPVSHWLWNGGTWILSSTVRDRDGGAEGYNCVNWQGVAKNILTIGAVGDIPAGYQTPSDVVLAGFSNTGPADDGRIKPDIVANGTGLYSTYSTNNTSYASLSGTSMSTPNTSGSIGLLLHQWKNLTGSSSIRSATMKGLIIHTANESGTNPGPDYNFGWGLMNTKNAALLMGEDATNGFSFNVRELSLSQGETITIPVYTKGTEPLLATICWTDPPSEIYGQYVDDPTPMLVNDLDIRLVDDAGVPYYPWMLDVSNPSAAATTGDNLVDNVEKNEPGTPASERTWFVQISHKGTLVNSDPQNFSLILSGITPAPLTTEWTGTQDSDWNTPANWTNGIPSVSTDVTIPGNTLNKPTIASAAYCNNLMLSDGASILGNNLLTVGGTTTVERFMTADKYHYISSPVANAEAGSIFPLTAFLRYYDETEPLTQWVNIYQHDVVQPSLGYALFVPVETGDITATFTGPVNDGTTSANNLSFTQNSTLAYDGYNLIGNPYPSPIDLESSSIVRTNLDAAVYFWDPELNSGLGSYATWTIGGTGINGATQYIPVAQGFFVKVSGNGLTGSFAMDNNTRTHSTHAFYKGSGLSNTLRLTAAGGLFSDETVIRFAEGSTSLFDSQTDAWKLMTDQANQLYTRASDNGKLAINCIQGPEQYPVVPLNYTVAAPGLFTLTSAGTDSFDPAIPIVLLDLKTSYRQDLRQMPDYQFTASPGDDENRFAIAFGTLGTNHTEFEPVSIYANGKNIYLNYPANTSGKLQLRDMSGRIVLSNEVGGNNKGTIYTQLPAGIYIASFTSNTIRFSNKIVIGD